MLQTDDVLVVQLTGRMHHGAARGLHANGRLATLLTDFSVPRLFHLLARTLSPVLRNYCIDLPSRKVRGNPLVGLQYRAQIRKYGAMSALPHVVASRALARQASSISASVDFSTVFSFDIQALETFSCFSGQGKRLILEQCVAPRKAQHEMLLRLAELIPVDERKYRLDQLCLLASREEQEWALADLIVCPSTYVQDQLHRFGVPKHKTAVVPYGFTARDNVPCEVRSETDQTGMLQLLFVGTVEPRKGIHDLAAAVSRLNGKASLAVFGARRGAFQFDFDKNLVTLHGRAPFATIQQAYLRSDVFALPSYLEGSATVVYEAMSYGLPCIVSPETGSVVRDGVEGFVVTPGDIAAITEKIELLSRDRELRQRMGAAARARAAQFTLEGYGRRLCEVL